MKIQNETKWRTKDLQRLVADVCRQTGFDKPKKVVFVNSHSWRVHGVAWLHSGIIKIFMPTKEIGTGSDGVSTWQPLVEVSGTMLEAVGEIVAHELRHAMAGEHDEDLDINAEHVTLDFVVAKQEAKLKVPRDLVSERRQHVVEMIADKESKVKGLQNQLKKLYKRRGYYGS